MMPRLEVNPERWIRLPTVDSSNSFAMREALPSGSVVLARKQTAGRGSMGRTWQSEPGSVIFTGVLEFDAGIVPDDRLALFAILAGVAVMRAASAIVPGEYRIKEPNDVLVLRGGPGKIAGVLVESEITAEKRRVFIGIGINVSTAPPPMDSIYPPAPLISPAQSRAGISVSTEHCARLLVLEINARLDQMTGPEMPAFLGEAAEFRLSA